jgi:hypothetical protein
MTHLRLVPPAQQPNAQFPLVPLACDLRPMRCDACSMRVCPFNVLRPFEGELPHKPKGAA